SKEHPDLPAVVVDTVLKRLHRSFTNFFHSRKVGFPRFKSANAWNTIQFRDKYNHLDEKFKFARIVLRPSGWYLQCVCETEPHPLPKKDNAVGLDMGIRYLVADSNGQIIENPKHAKKSAKRLAKAQKRLSRCKKGSN